MGHDPHDLLTSPVLRRVRGGTRAARITRLAALQFGRRSGIDLRSLLRVPPTENPKALALFLGGLLKAKEKVTPHWEHDAKDLVHRLLRSMREFGWGYPFPWQSRTHFLSEHTPNIVTTSFVGNALTEWDRHSPAPELERAIRRAAEYILSLQVHPASEQNGVAFGYAENDSQIVFNASILGAGFLQNAGKLLANSSYIERAHHAAKFVMAHQRADGGWGYGLEKSQHWTDSFHTGFTIRSMKAIAEEVGDPRLANAALRGFEYYRQNFLEPDFAIGYFPHRRYPIDAHALGDAMLTFSAFGEQETAINIAQWAIEHLRSPNGFFYYQRHRVFTNRIPYIRWSNAWIFRGLAECVTPEA